MGILYTFYSYKGGVGRSMALANVAALLSSWGHSVLAIDWDLEAPGLEKYFTKSPSRLEGSRAERDGVVDIVTAFAAGERIDWEKGLIKAYPFGGEAARVDIIGAGRDTPEYVPRLQDIDWRQLFNEKGFGSYLEEMRDEWLNKYEFVLVDSRTGITDIGGVCTIHLPDILVLLFTANEQSLDGVIDVMGRAQAKYDLLPEELGRLPKLKGVPVPSRFEYLTEYESASRWLKKFADRLPGIYADWLPEGTTPRTVLEKLFVPNIPFWSFGEGLPVVQEGMDNPRSLGYAYALLARLLEQHLDWDAATREPGTLHTERPPAVVDREADAALAALADHEERVLARRVLLNLVLPVPTDKGEDARRLGTPLAEFDEDERRVIDKLAESRLLTKGRNEKTGEETVEIAQDAILRHWGRFKKWVDDSREFLLWRQQLGANWGVWKQGGKKTGNLLQGPALTQAMGFLKTHEDDLKASEVEYIKAAARLRRLGYAMMVAVVALVLIGVGYYGYTYYLRWQEAERVRLSQLALQQAEQATATGRNLGSIRQFGDAVKAYDQAIEAKPDYAPAYLYRGIAYKNLGSNDQALADFNKVVALSTDRKDQDYYDALTYIEQLNTNITPVEYPTPTPTPRVAPSPGTTPTPAPTPTPTTNLLPRVYIQVQRGVGDEKAREVASLLQKSGFVVARVQPVAAVPDNTQVRYYRQADSAGAERILNLLRGLGMSGAQPRYIIGYENSTALRPRHYEIWFSTADLNNAAP